MGGLGLHYWFLCLSRAPAERATCAASFPGGWPKPNTSGSQRRLTAPRPLSPTPAHHPSLGTQKHIHTGNQRLQGGRNRPEPTPQFIWLPRARRKAELSLEPVITAAQKKIGFAFSNAELQDGSPAGDGNTGGCNGGSLSPPVPPRSYRHSFSFSLSSCLTLIPHCSLSHSSFSLSHILFLCLSFSLPFSLSVCLTHTPSPSLPPHASQLFLLPLFLSHSHPPSLILSHSRSFPLSPILVLSTPLFFCPSLSHFHFCFLHPSLLIP